MLIGFIILLSFLFSAVGSAVIYRTNFRIALIDIPNQRSSHSIPTPRGGGIGLWIALILVGIFVTRDLYFSAILSVAGLLGFLEDCFTLSAKVRLFSQCVISSFIVVLFSGLPVSPLTIALFLFWILFIASTTNFYNFMDGINGIAGLTGLVGFGLMAYFSYLILDANDVFLMSAVLAAGCIGFLPFNFPRARVFMGDVGSIFLGFVFAAFVVKLSASFNVFICVIMFLCTFYADAVVTIYYRWRRGENLMLGHRSHLYQYMSNELAMPHWEVSIIYAAVQLLFGILAILAFQVGLTLQIMVFTLFSILFVISYVVINKMKPVKAMRNK